MRKSRDFAVVLMLGLAACGPGKMAASSRSGAVSALDVPPMQGAVAAPEAPFLGAVRFGRVDAKVGDRTQTAVVATSRADETVRVYESQFITEVVAVAGPAPTRVRVTFEKNTAFDNVTTQPTSIDAKSYFVDVAEPHVVDAVTQQEPTTDEIMRVLDVFPDLGTRTQIDQILPDTGMQIGDHRDDLAPAIARILHPRYWSFEHGSAVLARVEGEIATFSVVVDAVSSLSRMKMSVKGEMKIRIRDARLDGFMLKGTFERPEGGPGTLEILRTIRDY